MDPIAPESQLDGAINDNLGQASHSVGDIVEGDGNEMEKATPMKPGTV